MLRAGATWRRRSERPALLVALERHSAERVFAWGENASTKRCGGVRPWVWGDASAGKRLLSGKVRDGRPPVVVVHSRLLAWLDHASRPSGVDIVYLRPGAMVLSEIWRELATSHGPRRDRELRRLLRLDERLSAGIVVELERLYFEPEAASKALAQALRLDPTGHVADFGGETAYREAMGGLASALLAAHPGELLGDACAEQESGSAPETHGPPGRVYAPVVAELAALVGGRRIDVVESFGAAPKDLAGEFALWLRNIGAVEPSIENVEQLAGDAAPRLIDLIVLWRDEQLGEVLQRLANRPPEAGLPLIAAPMEAADLFYHLWRVHSVAVEQLVFDGAVTIGQTWALIRPERA